MDLLIFSTSRFGEQVGRPIMINGVVGSDNFSLGEWVPYAQHRIIHVCHTGLVASSHPGVCSSPREHSALVQSRQLDGFRPVPPVSPGQNREKQDPEKRQFSFGNVETELLS